MPWDVLSYIYNALDYVTSVNNFKREESTDGSEWEDNGDWYQFD